MQENSICLYIPTFKRHALLHRALDSVFEQTIIPNEIIIVNDDKEEHDNFLMQIEDCFNDSRISVLQNNRTKGACGARNTAIFRTRSRFITGLDDDDILKPFHIENLMENFDTQYSFIVPNYQINRKNRKKKLFGKSKVISKTDFFYGNCVGNQFFTLTERVKKIGGFDEKLHSCQDADVMARLLSYGPCKRLKDVTYMQDTSSADFRITTSTQKTKGMEDFLSKHKERMNPSQIHGLKFKIARIKQESWIPYISLKTLFYFLRSSKLKR